MSGFQGVITVELHLVYDIEFDGETREAETPEQAENIARDEIADYLGGDELAQALTTKVTG